MLKVNDYFEGKVKSIGFENGSTGKVSVGVMLPGEYIFNTDNPEEMTVITGSLKVLLPTQMIGKYLKLAKFFILLKKANSMFRYQNQQLICVVTSQNKDTSMC